LEKVTCPVLDLLVDGESSFAALFVGLRRFYRELNIEVRPLLDALEGMEQNHLVRLGQMNPDGSFRTVRTGDRERWIREYEPWLPSATTSEAALDEVGLWVEITTVGRELWATWAHNADGA
jgi:hypothetical protein